MKDQEEILDKEYDDRIDRVHDSTWSKFASLGGILGLLAPVFNEFPEIGESIAMSVGGTSAVAVFAIMLKVYRVFGFASNFKEEHKKDLNKFKKRQNKLIKEKREKRINSVYLHDF